MVVVVENKKTPVTVGGVGMPFAPNLKAQDPPVTGVSCLKIKIQSPGYQSGGLVGQCKDTALFKQI